MSVDRIEALERAVRQLAECIVAQAQAATAQAVVCRAMVDMLGQAGASLEDVRDHAVAMAETMSTDMSMAVRMILAESSVMTETIQ